MATGILRKIVRIDEEKCNGCGLCVPSCAEGALQIVDGKARLVSERQCDGLGACIGECPLGAITVEERLVEPFDEEISRLAEHIAEHDEERLPCGCPSATATHFNRECAGEAREACGVSPSELTHWPVQLALVPSGAPFLKAANLLLAADCVPFAYGGFHRELLRGHVLLVACPKLDPFQSHLKKLTEILRQCRVSSLTVAHMEVPCCSGLVHMAKEAMRLSGTKVPLREVTIGIRGDANCSSACSQ